MSDLGEPQFHSDLAPKVSKAVSHSVNILMVDDHDPNLTALEVILDTPHYHLIKARSGLEAIEFARQHEFAAILLDVQMPGMDGFETARRLRAIEKDYHTPIVFVTAIDRDNSYAERGYEVGAVDYIVKPINPKILKPKIDFFAESFLSRKRLAALESEARFHLMADAAPAMIWICDRNRVSYWFNKACLKFLGRSSEEQRKMGWEKCVHPEDLKNASQVFYGSFNKRQPFTHDYRLLSANGKYRWVLDNGTPYYDTSGHFRGYMGVCLDIEDQKQAVRARDEFLSIASHELKTPVTSLKLQLQMLNRQLAKDAGAIKPEYLKNLAEVGNRQINQLVNLIDDMLDVSRISTGHLNFEMATEDLAQIAREVALSFAEQFQTAGIELRTQFEGGLSVSCDRQRMEQVISNLLTNAIKYGEKKPVTMKVLKQGPHAVIRVEDQGMGISEENQTRIFARFERAVSPTTVSGLGLGLYISQQIVHRHDGHIRVCSAPGQGSTFEVLLPLTAKR